MSKKTRKNRNRLGVIFLILLVAVVAVLVNKNKKGERSFKAELLEFNIEDVSSLSIFSKSSDANSYIISRDSDNWSIMTDGKTFDADNDLLDNMVDELAELKAVQKVAASKDKWGDFDVTDSTGVHVVVNQDKKTIGDIFIGRFSYNQNTRKPKTFVRLNKDKDVFAVEGYLSMTFNRGIEGLRNKSIFRGNQNDLTKIAFNFPADSSYTLVKDSLNMRWTMNGMPTDSTRISNFLGSVSYLSGAIFRDDLDPAQLNSSPFSVILEGRNMSPVEIKGTIDEQGKHAILSSLNPTSVFDGDNGDLFSKIFVGPVSFIPTGQ